MNKELLKMIERLSAIAVCETECRGRCSECPAEVANDAIKVINDLYRRINMLEEILAAESNEMTGLEYRGG